jgi:hypothetical protein
MLSGSAAHAALESKHPTLECDITDTGDIFGSDRIVENLSELPVPPSSMGSFDCVRLAPHFAQEDRAGVGGTNSEIPLGIASRRHNGLRRE